MSNWLDSKWKRGVILLLTFALSVLIRIPNLDRPLSKHHEFVTAVSLRVLQVWEQEGAMNLGFNPAMNYSGETNKWIDNHATSLHKLHDESGNYYYTSHPPFAYILPYVSFKLIGAKATVLNLQVFHLIFHFLSALLVLLIVKHLGGNRKTQLLGFVIYCFLPATLWFQSNTYMSDMLVHFFFLLGILTLLKIKSAPSKSWFLLSLFIVMFLMTYTSWLSVFFAFSGGIFSLLYLKESRWKVVLTLAMGTLAGLTLMFVQYSSINGFSAFWEQLVQRFGVRGSNSTEATTGFFSQKLKELGLIAFNYAVNYGSLVILVLSVVILKVKGGKLLENNKLKPFVFISVLPILLLHFVLLNYSGHDFTTLYLSAFLSVIAAFILSDFSFRQQVFQTSMILTLGCFIYFWVNRPGEMSQNGDLYNEFALQGEFIHTSVSDDDVVFWMGKELDPMTIVYAKRNVVEISDPAKAREYLQKNGFDKGIIITVKPGLLEAKKIDR